jgi:hypothetical protein
MAAPSNTTGIAGLHPAMGLQLEVRASYFGKEWAKKTFGDEWESAKLEGVVRDFQRGKTAKTDKWKVCFAMDSSEYWWKKEQLLAHGVPPRLLETGESAEVQQPVDLRTPQSKGTGDPKGKAKEVPEAGGRPRRAVRPPSRYDEGPSDADDDDQSGGADERSKEKSGDEGTESDGEAATVEQHAAQREQQRARRFEKRAKKPKGRKPVPRQLLGGGSDDEEEEHSDDEQLVQEGDPLETAEEAGPSAEAGSSTAEASAAWEWRAVGDGDASTNLQPAEWQGSRHRVPRALLSDLPTLSPFQIFLLLVPVTFWRWAVEQTNLYAQASRDNAPGTEKGKSRGWVPVTLQELLKWVGIVFSMALHPLPALSDYWRRGRVGNIVFPDTGTIMSQARFEQIKRYFHLNDNSQRPPQKDSRDHRLWQVVRLVDTLNDTFKKCYNLSQFVTFDERTVPLRNRACPIRIYNPKKPHKFGIEIFAAVDSESFYCWHQHIYDKIKQPDLHERMVEELAATLQPRVGHIIILDRGFTGPVVLNKLLGMGFQATGTCVATRKNFPANLVKLPARSERGTVSAAVCEDPEMVAFCWMDKQPVLFVTTSHSLDMGVTGRRSGAVVEEIPCPEAAYVYNKNKDGVDQFDKACLLKGYSAEMEIVSRKWWHRLFWGLLDSAVSNAHILFRVAHPDVSRFDFYVTLQEQLVANTMDIVLSRSMSRGGEPASLPAHFPALIPDGKRRRCAMCTLKKRGLDIEDQKEVCHSRYWCPDCQKGFCPDECFREWHTTERLEGRDFGPKRMRKKT